jgi:hypothetical protein
MKRIELFGKIMESAMTDPTADEMRQNAENCADLATDANDAPGKKRYERMQQAWNSLADTQDWLDGKKKANGSGQSAITPQSADQSAGDAPR